MMPEEVERQFMLNPKSREMFQSKGVRVIDLGHGCTGFERDPGSHSDAQLSDNDRIAKAYIEVSRSRVEAELSASNRKRPRRGESFINAWNEWFR
jgi:hypothetical protein